jgi:YXWGXW repeat-containing protein
MTRLSTLRLIAGFVATAAIGACYSSPDHVYGVAYGTYEPPLTPVEVIPSSPGFNYVWIGGHYRWDSDRYVWTPGSWAVPARGYSVWVPGRWDRDGHGWFWVNGHWR